MAGGVRGKGACMAGGVHCRGQRAWQERPPLQRTVRIILECILVLIAGSLESAYSLNWGAHEIWGQGGGETLALLL